MTTHKKEIYWLRLGVNSNPSIFDKEPESIVNSIRNRLRFGSGPKYKGRVLQVIDKASYDRAISLVRDIEPSILPEGHRLRRQQILREYSDDGN